MSLASGDAPGFMNDVPGIDNAVQDIRHLFLPDLSMWQGFWEGRLCFQEAFDLSLCGKTTRRASFQGFFRNCLAPRKTAPSKA